MPAEDSPRLAGRRVTLIVSGGVAAVRSYDLLRALRRDGALVTTVLTAGALRFVTRTAMEALAESPAHTDLFADDDAAGRGASDRGVSGMTHIRLAREADALVVAPLSAGLLARMACGMADDLAAAVLLATEAPILAAPAMNVAMWRHPAVQRNVRLIGAQRTTLVGPATGRLACGEHGAGRMASIEEIIDALRAMLGDGATLEAGLAGRRALVTSGPTFESWDDVRYLANRSSGKQGNAVAASLARLGARTTLVSGPASAAAPAGVDVVAVESARQMLDACLAALPVDIAVCAAAVADWRPVSIAGKLHAAGGASAAPPRLEFERTDDILAALARERRRPALLVGFAAEDGQAVSRAESKRRRKGCDWILANDIAGGRLFGADDNQVTLLDGDGAQRWPLMSKRQLADRLARRIAGHFQKSAGRSC